jgi:hypothetical protein
MLRSKNCSDGTPRNAIGYAAYYYFGGAPSCRTNSLVCITKYPLEQPACCRADASRRTTSDDTCNSRFSALLPEILLACRRGKYPCKDSTDKVRFAGIHGSCLNDRIGTESGVYRTSDRTCCPQGAETSSYSHDVSGLAQSRADGFGVQSAVPNFAGGGASTS